MKKFIDKDFLLENEYARELYHNYAKDLPLVDFHCHLDPQQVAEDKRWDNISQLWLEADSYKWRAMRGNGVDEYYCTGDAPDREKFQKFAETLPELLRSPMYHWAHLELARYFGIDDVLLNGDTAEDVWRRTSEQLGEGMSAHQILESSKVEVLCTNDDPTSDLKFHKAVRDSGFGVKILPSFRPDRAFAIESQDDYVDYLNELEAASGVEIRSYDDLLNALKRRHDYFHSVGCRVSNYEIDTVWYKKAFYYEVEDTFKKAISSSEQIAPDEILAFKSAILLECAAMDYDKGWVRQLHIGTMRNTNIKMLKQLGANKGFDAVGESNYAHSLAMHLNKLNNAGKLGKTILYNTNPKDNAMGSILADFQGSDCAAKLQLGGAWWGVMDHVDGIRRQLDSMAAMSVPGRFVGTASDARSFLSISRHEYFRRALCSVLGSEMQRGLLPADVDLVGTLAKKISYDNAKNYFAM